ncbi:MAG: DUF4302 domain-containing protein [Rikenellaceae bacterium]|nr:DUF4302 domain-containing protein [Rikenellaceae bacterium]
MKKLLLLITLTGLLIPSCKIEIDETFDTSASERIEAVKQEFSELLLSSPAGWIIEYYPGENRPYGGYVLLARFHEDGTVSLSSQAAEDFSQVLTSTYSINGSQSAVLSFDGYNEMIHYWCDPQVTGGAGTSVGYGGDFEFVYYSGDRNQILTRGKKRSSVIRFTKFPEDTTWEQYLTDLADLVDQMLFATYNLQVGDQETVVMTLDANGYQILQYNHPDEPNPDIYTYLPFIYTDTGIKLYEPLDIFSVQLQNFQYVPDSKTFICTDEGVDAVIECKMNEGYVYYEEFLGDYTLYYATSRGNLVENTVTVSLVEDVPNESFKLTGLQYDIYIGFNRTMGIISMLNNNNSVELGTYLYNGEDKEIFLWLITDTGHIYRTNYTYGMDSEISYDADGKMIVQWKENGVCYRAASRNMESIAFYYYTNEITSSYQYLSPRYYGPLSMVKY